MVKQVALDTNIAIGLLNHQAGIFNLLHEYERIFLPVTVCGELIFGAKNSKLSLRNEKRYLNFIESCELLDINLVVAEMYSSIRLELKRKGKPIPENDIWIAAVCIVNDMPLYTFDKHFQHVKSLVLIK